MIRLAKKKTTSKSRKTVKAVKKVRRRELSALEKNVLWCFALGSKSTEDVANALNLMLERAEEVVSRLADSGFIMERGGFFKAFELTAQGYEILGTPGIKLESRIVTETIRSGDHTKLIVTAKNVGNAPITDAIIKVTAPKFITISRYGSEYEGDEETSVVQFPLTHLNPGETQTLEFNLHGALTSGTVASKYRIFVHAMIGEEITDKKELGITLLE